MDVHRPDNGQQYSLFPDALGNVCRVQTGRAEGPNAPLLSLGRLGSEMLLTRRDVGDLLPHLQQWLLTATLTPPETTRGPE